MEVALAIVLVAGLFAAPFLIGKVRRGLGRTIQPNAHREGQHLVKVPVTFTAPRPPAEVLASIRSTVNGYPAAPVFMPGLYEQPLSSSAVAFTFGSKVTTVFSGILTCRADAEGTSGQFQIAKWTEGDGIVVRREEIHRVQERITSAITSLGGAVMPSTD